PVAAGGIGARRAAQQGQRLACEVLLGQAEDAVVLGPHLLEVAGGVLLPRDRRAVLAMEVVEQRLARRELLDPGVPRLVFPADAARPDATDQQSLTVLRWPRRARIVPAAGPDRHPHDIPRSGLDVAGQLSPPGLPAAESGRRAKRRDDPGMSIHDGLLDE